MKNNEEKSLLIHAAAKCVGGDVRANEDNIFFNGDYIQEDLIDEVFEVKSGKPVEVNVFAICDGMGKGGVGSEASMLAVTELEDLFRDMNSDETIRADDMVLDYINDVNEAIGVHSQQTGRRSATTLALLIIENDVAHVYNLGDSRIYLKRGEKFRQISRDHLPRRGEKINSAFDNKVSQFLGVYDNETSLSPYRAKPVKIQAGDCFVLCSDGITDYIDDKDLSEIIFSNRDAFGHCSEIINKAAGNSSRDNMSVAVIHIDDKKFKPTANMILSAIAAGILIMGFVLGYLVGYMFGNSQYGRNEDFHTQLVASNVVSEELSSVIVDEAVSGDVISEDVSSAAKATRIYFPGGKDVFTLKAGESIDLKKKLTIKPEGAETGKLKWKSSNTNVAVVDQNGICKVGGSGGVARITVENEDGIGGYCDVECKAAGNAVTTIPKTTTPRVPSDSVSSKGNVASEITRAPEQEGAF